MSEQVSVVVEHYDNDALAEANEQLGLVVARLYAENAKLRELARHLRECTRRNSCAACEYADDACDFDYDMRELGIEYEER